MPGKEHGSYTVEFQNSIIRLTIAGAFNEYAVQNYARIIREKRTGQNGKFGLLEIALDYEGATPQAFIEADKFNDWLNHSECVGKAIVIARNFQLTVSESNQKSWKNQNYRIFDREEEAREWLESLLAESGS